MFSCNACENKAFSPRWVGLFVTETPHRTRARFSSTAQPAPIHKAPALGGLCRRHWGELTGGAGLYGALDSITALPWQEAQG